MTGSTRSGRAGRHGRRRAWPGKRKAHLLAIRYPPDQIEAMKNVAVFDPGLAAGRGTCSRTLSREPMKHDWDHLCFCW
jgi:hypothetical protein